MSTVCTIMILQWIALLLTTWRPARWILTEREIAILATDLWTLLKRARTEAVP